MLRFFKDRSSEWSVTQDEFKNQYQPTDIEETYDWIMQNGWFEKGADQRGYQLNFKGKSILEQIENEKERTSFRNHRRGSVSTLGKRPDYPYFNRKEYLNVFVP